MEVKNLETTTEQICLQSLRDLIQKDNLIFPDEEEFLMKFLRAKDFKVESAFEAFKGYIQMRKAFPTNYHPGAVRKALESGMVSVLKHRDLKGRQVFYYRTYLWDTNAISATEAFLACTLIMEEMLFSEDTQINGIVFLHDMKGLNWRHCYMLGINELKRVWRIKKGFPGRFKLSHVINSNKAVRFLSAILFSFIPAKMQKRFKFYNQDLSELYESIPPTQLPKSVGGDLTEEEAIDHDLMTRLLEREEYFINTSKIICRSE